MLRLCSITLMFICFGANAYAFCSEPGFFESPPNSPGTYARPDPPFCMSGYGSGGCDDWEVQSYIDEVNDYIDDLNQYAQDAQQFAKRAINYANEVADYTRCEADDVKSQHQ